MVVRTAVRMVASAVRTAAAKAEMLLFSVASAAKVETRITRHLVVHVAAASARVAELAH